MASRTVYACDRCGKPGTFHLDLDLGPEAPHRLVDFCVPCGAEAIRCATERMGPPAKRDWLDDLLPPDDADGPTD